MDHDLRSTPTKSKETWEWVRAIGGALILAWLIQQFLFQLFMVDGHSMDPTLQNGERAIVDKLIYEMRAPRYGEIVIFKYPVNPTQDFIKRVIGLPGDTIEVRDHVVYRNGQPLNEPYINAPVAGQYPPTQVPAGTIFCMGDNRNYSDDSRTFGPVPLKNVVGRADVIVWPFDRFEFLPFTHNQPPTGLG
ncbi:MAG: signal peptidase [Bacilli bacterium]|nr:signal peptidase [Bacilli bacterium]